MSCLSVYVFYVYYVLYVFLIFIYSQKSVKNFCLNFFPRHPTTSNSSSLTSFRSTFFLFLYLSCLVYFFSFFFVSLIVYSCFLLSLLSSASLRSPLLWTLFFLHVSYTHTQKKTLSHSIFLFHAQLSLVDKGD